MVSGAYFEQTALVHLNYLYSIAVRMTQNEDDGQDLVQETFMRAFRSFDTFKPGTNCKAWLRQILRNTFINRYRQQRTRPYLVDFDDIEETWENQVQDRGPKLGNPEEILLNSILREDVREAFMKLSPPYRRALSLSLVGGHSYREIADMMGCPIGTVMSRVHRARVLTQERLLRHAEGRSWAAMQAREKRSGARDGERVPRGIPGRPLAAHFDFAQRTPLPSMSDATTAVSMKTQSL